MKQHANQCLQGIFLTSDYIQHFKEWEVPKATKVEYGMCFNLQKYNMGRAETVPSRTWDVQKWGLPKQAEYGMCRS